MAELAYLAGPADCLPIKWSPVNHTVDWVQSRENPQAKDRCRNRDMLSTDAV